MRCEIHAFLIDGYALIRAHIEKEKARLAEAEEELKWLEFLYFCHHGKFPND